MEFIWFSNLRLIILKVSSLRETLHVGAKKVNNSKQFIKDLISSTGIERVYKIRWLSGMNRTSTILSWSHVLALGSIKYWSIFQNVSLKTHLYSKVSYNFFMFSRVLLSNIKPFKRARNSRANPKSNESVSLLGIWSMKSGIRSARKKSKQGFNISL